MDVTRRELVGFTGSAVAAASFSVRASAAVPAGLAAAADNVRAFVLRELADKGFPGIAVSLLAADGASTSFVAGLANLAARAPARPDQLFQIGSISKSLTALAVHALADRGTLDLGAPVQALLPDYPLPSAPITVTQLLEHSSGLPNSLVEFPFLDVPGGRLWTGFAPGSRYSYCNLGYGLLGAIVERAAAMPFGDALQRLVLRPIGMANAEPAIRIADRARYADGHQRFRTDLPWLPRAPLVPARWVELHNAAGSVAATAADMERYLAYVVKLGRGEGAPVLSDAAARRFAAAPIDAPPFGAGGRYGNGLAHVTVAGRPCLHHTGGMTGFSSAMLVDPVAGVGAFASVNVGGAGNYRPREVTEFALAQLAALAAGAALPPVPAPKPPPAIDNPARFIGTWRREGEALQVVARGPQLAVIAEGVERPLAAVAATAFLTDHPRLAPWRLDFEEGRLRIGSRLYGRDVSPPRPPESARTAGLAGAYLSGSSWSAAPTIVSALGDRLWIGGTEWTEAPDGYWRTDEPALLGERAWFTGLANGRATVLNLSGMRHERLPA